MAKDVYLKLGVFDHSKHRGELSLKQVIQNMIEDGDLVISSNISIDLGETTVTGTLAEFNAAISDADFASLTGSETLTNKTLTAAILTNPKFTANVRRAIGAVVTGTADATLSAANMVLGKVFQLTGGTGRTFTLDTGAALSAAMPSVAVGDAITFTVSNASTGTITMGGASGTTLANAMTVATLQSRTFVAINTGTNTWTIY